MYLVDLHTYDEERYLIVIDTTDATRSRIEKVSDQRFGEFLQKVLDTDIALGDIEQEYAA
jgi:hypothetical protein